MQKVRSIFSGEMFFVELDKNPKVRIEYGNQKLIVEVSRINCLIKELKNAGRTFSKWEKLNEKIKENL
jgi:hypothetical protein